jgi:hypothetical protein
LKREAVGIEIVQAAGGKPQPYLVARIDARIARRADDDLIAGLQARVKEGVAAKGFAKLYDRCDSLALWHNLDVFRPDPDAPHRAPSGIGGYLLAARLDVQEPKFAKTAPAMAITFMEGSDVPYGKIMATATLIVVPVLIFALIVSRHLVRGLTMGAVK